MLRRTWSCITGSSMPRAEAALAWPETSPAACRYHFSIYGVGITSESYNIDRRGRRPAFSLPCFRIQSLQDMCQIQHLVGRDMASHLAAELGVGRHEAAADRLGQRKVDAVIGRMIHLDR